MKFRIEELARELGEPVQNEEGLDGGEYYSGELSDYRFWIYDTGGADFGADWYRKIFERYDYSNEDAQADDFIESLRHAIKEKEILKRNPRSRKKPVLNRLFERLAIWKK